jgi:hypothetical protein
MGRRSPAPSQCQLTDIDDTAEYGPFPRAEEWTWRASIGDASVCAGYNDWGDE